MAKFVIAGKANCPYYAKAELVADQLVRNLPDFKIHKIVKDPNEWDKWLKDICQANKWKHTKSPIIWRELVDRGGKGMLLGDHNSFQEYARDYYGIVSELNSDDLRKISTENENTFKITEQERLRDLAKIKPLNLTISNPDVTVVYYIMNELLSGEVFGADDVYVRLYSSNKSRNLEGVKMEIEDLASLKLRNIKIVHTPEDAFKNADYIILFDELYEDDQSEILNQTNPYISLGKDIDKYAKSTCKILITPFVSRSETCALVNVFSKQLTNINARKCLMGNSMSDEMLAKAVLGHRLKVNPGYIKNVLLIGQCLSDSFFLDLTCGQVTDFDGAVWARTNTHWLNLINMVADRDWIRKEYIELVKQRESLISTKLKRNCVLTFAQSVARLSKLWFMDHADDNSFYSAIVYANGVYSINEDIFLSVPVQFENKSFSFVKSYTINHQTRALIEEIVRDTKKKISSRYKEDKYSREHTESKLSIPHVIF